MNSERTADPIRTPRNLWGRLIVLLCPAAVLGVALKLLRIREFFPTAGWEETASKVSSDIAFGGAWVLVWTLGCLVTRRRLRTIIFYAAHLATLLVGLFAVINHEYVMTTGSPLTWPTLVDAAQRHDELAAVIDSQIDDSLIGLLIAVGVGVVVLPLILGPFLSRLLRPNPRTRVKTVSVVGLVVLLIASGWSAPNASAAFSLAPALRLAMAPVRAATAYPRGSAADAVTPTPETTRLVGHDGAFRNVVVITLESQRSAATLQDVKQPVTPVIDELMKTSIRPERGYSVLPHTSKALTAIHCGIAPPPDSDNSEADPDSLPAKCLPTLLAEQGYATSFFQSAIEKFERRRDTASNLGFQDFMAVDQMQSSGFQRANYFGYEDDIMLAPERNWLEDNGDKPFMLSMLTVTGHHDYTLQGYPRIDFVEDPVLNNYLNGIHYQDRFVGKVIDLFKELGLYENTVFVVVGDHGEGFGEHQIFQHDDTIYEEGIRIPFLIHDPQRAGELVDGPANQLTVLPTVVDLLGFELETDATYRPSLVSGEPQGPLVATCYARGKCTAIIDGDMKLIHHFGDRRDEVFNVAIDPHETTDLIGQTDQAWLTEMRGTALRWYVNTENSYAAFRHR
ncbi:LTA synthase family protein [Tessaracoccus antarcticus]|uniref:Sulfatase n=1 Tax=Tessaracoccus antarcticus TaxID=2479848 RepID=A0A3M0G9X3_9ACTN|nr:sulfatase-like hydrolase/transferase [Tessaracoccus antarcticus]RMB61785.1 sulfatase [Tessaracoccus antarcticus]